jgi:hypothetical protein
MSDDISVPEQAISEIKEILDKYDLACLAIVLSPDRMAYVRKIDPTWSCARVEEADDGDGYTIRIRSKLIDYGGDKARQKMEVEATTGMFISFMGWAKATLDEMTKVTVMLGKAFPQILHSETWRKDRW